MIVRLRGKLIEKKAKGVILDVSGVGYNVELTTSSMASQPAIGSETTIFTFLHVREDAWQLFGFVDLEEKSVFEKLISISGIGPKLAMSILSSYSVDDFKRAILNEDADLLTSIPRLGSKNAKRIILELKGKLVTDNDVKTPYYKEARIALKNLGYTNSEINKSLNACNGENSAEELVRTALKVLANE